MSTLAKNRNEMRVEREIAGFAFPFAVGVTAAVIMGASPCTISTTYHTIVSGSILLSSTLLLYSFRNRWNDIIILGLIALAALSCGAMTGLSATEMRISGILSESRITISANEAVKVVKSLIDMIPFENQATGEIIKALLTGSREDITEDISQAFRDSGASHILALSGLHLGIIYAIIVKTLTFAGNSPSMRRAKSILTIFICGFYTLATGAGASITRAFLFIAINEIGKMTGRLTSLKTVLGAALLIHLTFDPDAVSEVGFQLSYAAIFGIAYIFPWLRRLWKNDWRWLKWIWESLAVSISCQVTTGPLAYWYFGTFPQYFLLTNLIAVPLAGLIIPASLLVTALTALGVCPQFLTETTEWMVTILTQSLEIIATM